MTEKQTILVAGATGSIAYGAAIGTADGTITGMI